MDWTLPLWLLIQGNVLNIQGFGFSWVKVVEIKQTIALLPRMPTLLEIVATWGALLLEKPESS